jgi:ABC-type uncharacterized transport system permease subunit
MALLDLNKYPTPRELKAFGVLFAVFFSLLGALFWWQAGWQTAALVVWKSAAFILVAYVLVPAVRKPIYLVWSYALYPIGYLITLVLMGVVYYLVITPTGLLMRLFGRDPLSRKFLPGAASYWIRRKEDASLDRYFRQY